MWKEIMGLIYFASHWIAIKHGLTTCHESVFPKCLLEKIMGLELDGEVE